MKQRFLLFAFVLAFAGLKAQDVSEEQTPLITKITATWCINCGTWGWDFFENIMDDSNTKAILVGAHPSGGLGTPVGEAFSDNFNAIGQPKFFFNNTDLRATRTNVAAKRSELTTLVDDLIAQSPLANVGFYAEVADNKINVRTKTKFFQDGGMNDYYLGLYVVENEVMSNQSGQGMTMHPNVIRGSFTQDVFGEILDASGTISSGTEISRDFSIDVANGWDLDNVSVVAILWNKNGDTFEYVNASRTNDFSGIPTSNIADIEEISSLEIFPTIVGAQSTLKVNLNNVLENAQIEIFDLSGKKITTVFAGDLQEGVRTFQINRDEFTSTGLHFLTITNNEKVISKRLIVE